MKFRNNYWIYGNHAVKAALINPNRKIHRIISIKNDSLLKLPSRLKMELVDKALFEKKFGSDTVHQGIAVEVTPLEPLSLTEFLQTASKETTILVLDQVTDPHNIGAILRTAAAMCIDAIILSDKHAPSESAILAKTASGALEITPIIREINLARTLDELKQNNFWCYGFAEGTNTDLHKCKFDGRIALVMGAEGKGLRRLTTEKCDVLTKIPTSQQFSTLNVSNAAALAMYEVMRQRVG